MKARTFSGAFNMPASVLAPLEQLVRVLQMRTRPRAPMKGPIKWDKMGSGNTKDEFYVFLT